MKNDIDDMYDQKPQRRDDVPWEKVPFVPRPSLIADPITAFGKRKPTNYEHIKKRSILDTINREAIKPDPIVLNRPIAPYVSAREVTRNKVLEQVRKNAEKRELGGSAAIATDPHSMDVALVRAHKTTSRTTPIKENHKRIFFVSDPTYLSYRKV